MHAIPDASQFVLEMYNRYPVCQADVTKSWMEDYTLVYDLVMKHKQSFFNSFVEAVGELMLSKVDVFTKHAKDLDNMGVCVLVATIFCDNFVKRTGSMCFVCRTLGCAVDIREMRRLLLRGIYTLVAYKALRYKLGNADVVEVIIGMAECECEAKVCFLP